MAVVAIPHSKRKRVFCRKLRLSHAFLSHRHGLVLDARGLPAPHALLALLLVLVVAPLEEHHLGVSLIGHDVRGDLVEEPAVVRDDHGDPVPRRHRLLQRAQRGDVQVVGGLVQHQHVAAAGQRLRQLEPVALPPRQLPHLLLLVPRLEVVPRAVRACVDGASPQADLVGTARQRLVHRLGVVQVAAVLVNVHQLHRLAHHHRARVRRVDPCDHPEQSGLARAVGAHDAHHRAGRDGAVQILDEQPAALVPLGHALDVDHGAA
mmetsp:Transcript_30406/g.76077  ORF Transcript_30406/g.76077 Transcript_30406/m.76077 type:complete len:263 (-) Transcript_30406:1885-2673(-)